MRYLPKDTSHMNFSELPETKADDSFSGPSHTFSGPTLGMFDSCQLSVLLQIFSPKTSVGCGHFKCHTFLFLTV
jgi:hypothetical protein